MEGRRSRREVKVTREQKYREQMIALGIYEEVFDPEIHTLCIMERDLQRLTKRWKSEGYQTVEKNSRGPAATDRTFDAIMTLRRQILAMKDALGLTPKALVRLKGRPAAPADEPNDEADGQTILQLVRDKYA